MKKKKREKIENCKTVKLLLVKHEKKYIYSTEVYITACVYTWRAYIVTLFATVSGVNSSKKTSWNTIVTSALLCIAVVKLLNLQVNGVFSRGLDRTGPAREPDRILPDRDPPLVMSSQFQSGLNLFDIWSAIVWSKCI